MQVKLVGRGKNLRHKGVFCLDWNGHEIAGDFIPAGTYDVQISLHGRVIHEIEDVVMVAGETNRDPRLQDIPWDRLGVARKIRVVDDKGHALAGCRVIPWRLGWNGGLPDTVRRTDKNGQVTAWILDGQTHFLFETKDGRVVRRDEITEDTTVVIGRRRILDVRLQGLVGLPKGYWLELRWRVPDLASTRDQWRIQPYQIRSSKGVVRLTEAETSLSLPGAIPLVAEIRLRYGADVRSEVVEGLADEIPVGAKQLEISWDAKAGAKALARLRSRRTR